MKRYSEGPQSLTEPVAVQWETFTYEAIGADGQLVEGLLEHNIWNEGVHTQLFPTGASTVFGARSASRWG
ncbi:MAG: hypothetical protein SangKO_027850 [Sandaracinaceae bacterium]